MKNIAIVLLLVPAVLFCNSARSQIQVQKRMEGDTLIIDSYNLKVKIPDGWSALPIEDRNLVVALASRENPTIQDSIFTVHLVPMLDENLTPSDVVMIQAQRKAARFDRKALIMIGPLETVPVAGQRAFKQLYALSIDEAPYYYEIVAFKKGKMMYVLMFWATQNGYGEYVKIFRKWIEENVQFINPNKDLDDDLSNKIIAEEKRIARDMGLLQH